MIYSLFAFLFRDQVRLLELFSAVNLIAWAGLMLARPGLVQRDSYRSFEALDARVWAVVFLGIAIVQLIGLFERLSHTANVRFLGMSLASGAWAVIAANFLNSGVSTTAITNYGMLAVLCALAGVFLGWKSKH